MTVMVCLDDKMGMMFGKRRQSKDIAVIRRMLMQAQDKELWMNSYSAGLFDGMDAKIHVDEAFLQHAPADAFCLVESDALSAYADRIDRVIIYRWNRRYPGNRFFDLELSAFHKLTGFDFPGNSHDTITEEIYIR